MNKKLGFGLIATGIVLVAVLMVKIEVSSASWPGPDYASDTGAGWRGDWTRSHVLGAYNIYVYPYYGYGWWQSERGLPSPQNPDYIAAYNGYLWFTWSHYDGSTWTDMQWYTSADSIDSGSGLTPYATMIKCHTWSDFIDVTPGGVDEGQIWTTYSYRDIAASP
jgi:hypothetical protein